MPVILKGLFTKHSCSLEVKTHQTLKKNKHNTVKEALAEYIFEEMELLLYDLILVVFALFNALRHWCKTRNGIFVM